MPDITLYFLQASRAIRVAWLLHELNLDYNLEFFDRVKEKAPPEMRILSGNPLDKSPCIRDNGVLIQESGAICQYLCSKHDPSGRLSGGSSDQETAKVLEWVHAAEGTFAVHGLTVVYVRWASPPEALKAIETFLSVNVLKDLDWLEGELAESKSGWLVGDGITLADIMVEFCVEFFFARKIGLRTEEGKRDEAGERWKNVKAWLKKCQESESYKKAVEKTGYTLFPKTGVNTDMHLAEL